jgi:hypothetical protein
MANGTQRPPPVKIMRLFGNLLRKKEFAFMLFLSTLIERRTAMERELYECLCRVLLKLAVVANRRKTYGDRLVIQVLLWAAVHDRPIVWACQERHWPSDLRPTRLISQSQQSRRLRTVSVHRLLERLYRATRDRLPRGVLKYVDGKPLPVGGCSKDPDARFGRAAGTIARGYKLVCITDESGAIDAWRLGAMNLCEHHEARHLLSSIPNTRLLADAEYDKNHLYEAAGQQGIELLAATKRTAKGLGHHRHSEHRLSAKALLQTEAGQTLMAKRTSVERSFAHASCFAGGLGPLPAWVRRPHRVATWAAAKLCIDAARRIRLLPQRAA